MLENVETELRNIKYVMNPFAGLDKNKRSICKVEGQEIRFRQVRKTPFSSKEANDKARPDSTTYTYKASLMCGLSTIPPTSKDAPSFGKCFLITYTID